ncbi:MULTISPECIES: hypothetical protein [Vibrio]|uniref:Uncharacterized protein n=1 Tax=Vibrio tasmaniensis TaxID=212663 RepID=A0A2N7NNB6_9VIBR|nr:hypothetical protein [Vibrio tasmaniensis]PMO89888.1 hypothetical protein BCT01_00985 [Vibrio tasmaniensis]PMP17754.1 hypothetical protein BCS92_04940 [Vibrio tasmaniensis]TKG27993.1 hypothetical protein FC057_22660 [Vibrio tasmaniensis]TKG41642.1 hypothetical protein FC063_07210 [Vibrio tasmaniensis]TKG44886.1 hypothetical protein FC061_20345 [Vibrio tasmaniensis]
MAYFNENGEVIFGRAPKKEATSRKKAPTRSCSVFEEAEIKKVKVELEASDGVFIYNSEGENFASRRHIGADLRVRRLRGEGYHVTPIFGTSLEHDCFHQESFVAHVTVREPTELEDKSSLTQSKLDDMDRMYQFAIKEICQRNSIKSLIDEEMLTDFGYTLGGVFSHIIKYHSELHKKNKNALPELLCGFVGLSDPNFAEYMIENCL